MLEAAALWLIVLLLFVLCCQGHWGLRQGGRIQSSLHRLEEKLSWVNEDMRNKRDP